MSGIRLGQNKSQRKASDTQFPRSPQDNATQCNVPNLDGLTSGVDAAAGKIKRHLHLLRGALCSPIPTFIMRFFTFGSCSYHVYCKLWLAASVPTATISKEKQFGTLSLAARSVAALLSIILYSCVIELAPPRRPSVMIITPADFCGILSTATIVNRGHVGRFLFAFLRPTRFNVTGKRRARFFCRRIVPARVLAPTSSKRMLTSYESCMLCGLNRKR